MARAVDLFEPWVMLPSQQQRRQGEEWAPEKRLMGAVLEDAFHSIARYSSHEVLAKEALKWLLRDENDHLFSFVSVCEYLNLEPQAVRVAIRKMLDERYEHYRTHRTNGAQAKIG